jgi:hypothetical protein
MDIVDNKSNNELVQSILAETAKAQNEVACARRDLEKATSRLKFVVMVANIMIERQGDQ